MNLKLLTWLAAVMTAMIMLNAVALAPLVRATTSECGVDVYNLDVRGNTISAYIKNTGCCTKAIYYTLYIDGGVVDSGQFTLASGSVRTFEKSYNFGYGRYDVRLTVTDNCFTDSDRILHVVLPQDSCCNPVGYEGQRRCDYDHPTVYVCQGGRWVSSPQDYCYYCGQTCGDGMCNCGETPQTCPEDCNCQSGWLNEYRCVDGWRQRKYMDADCETHWYNYEWVGRCTSGTCHCGVGCGATGCATCTGCCTGCGTWQEGWLDNYRCSGSWIQRWFVSGGLGGWKDWEFCPHGCRDGKCLDACGVDITSLDFKDGVTEGGRSDVKVSVRNLADSNQIISLAFYVNSERKGYYSVWLGSGNTLLKEFFFYPEKTSEIRVEASSNCGGSDVASATVHVTSKTTEEAYAPSNGSVPVRPAETSVHVFPDSLDVELGSSKTLAVEIVSSRPQDFSIEVAGVPEQWLSYEKKVGVNDKLTTYVYVTPKELGIHNIIVTAKALSENKLFKQNVNVFAARNINIIRFDWQGGFVTGLVSTVTSAWFLLVIAVIALMIVLLVGTSSLRY